MTRRQIRRELQRFIKHAIYAQNRVDKVRLTSRWSEKNRIDWQSYSSKQLLDCYYSNQLQIRLLHIFLTQKLMSSKSLYLNIITHLSVKKKTLQRIKSDRVFTCTAFVHPFEVVRPSSDPRRPSLEHPSSDLPSLARPSCFGSYSLSK